LAQKPAKTMLKTALNKGGGRHPEQTGPRVSGQAKRALAVYSS
jgi:hypothetical protein